MMNTRTEELIKYDAEHLLHCLGVVGQNLGVAPFETAQGIMIKDTEGKEYIKIL